MEAFAEFIVALYARARIETGVYAVCCSSTEVALYARARIETGYRWIGKGDGHVALYARARIETSSHSGKSRSVWSPSTRGRGLKQMLYKFTHIGFRVALYARARIETSPAPCVTGGKTVALYARARIETERDYRGSRGEVESPSTRGRGLKPNP